MCESKIVKKVTFTGSTNVAKLLYSMAASTLKKWVVRFLLAYSCVNCLKSRISIEAGGNAPFIVFDDANIDEAVTAAIACKFRGGGQTCVCANRLYVHASVYDEFASKLAAQVSAFKVGNGVADGV